MIGKQLFLERTTLDASAKVVEEILAYVKDQDQRNVLSPAFYSDALLLTAEVLAHTEQGEDWVKLGYDLCKKSKESMERYGYQDRLAMVGGLGYRCFAVREFCAQTGLLRSFSSSLDQLLLMAMDQRLHQIRKEPTLDENYDLISGVSGLLYYLLDGEYTREENAVLGRGIDYLLSLTRNTLYHGKDILGFHVLQPNQNRGFDQEDFRDGSINFGLAHGMMGPLIALAKAHSKGFRAAGLQEGIETLYHLYENYRSVNERNVPYWPRTITVEEYWAGSCRPEHLHKPCSWCYGNIGILRGLQKVAGYMNWTCQEQGYVEDMKRFLAQEVSAYDLVSPSLCHGYGSLVAIQACAYAAYQDPGLLRNLERHGRKLVEGYRKSNQQKVSLAEIQNETIWVEGYLEDLSLLTGSTGVAITLLAMTGGVKTGKLLMID